jgi:pyrroline-5-carboxylate reductase
LDRIQKNLNLEKVVRVMPNLALQVGAALSGWFASSAVSDEEKDFVKDLLKSFGDEIEVDDENKIDAITALSGSGPAYFYYLAEIIKKAAIKYGFSESQATTIASATFKGSAKLLDKGESAADLKQRVTSKGGTTEAALNYMAENDLEDIFLKAIEKARKRAEELKN